MAAEGSGWPSEEFRRAWGGLQKAPESLQEPPESSQQRTAREPPDGPRRATGKLRRGSTELS
eukprot:8030882-Alexandrium_andersonii.AAC.1